MSNKMFKRGDVMKAVKRVTADFSPEAYEILENVSALLKTNKAEALRRSLGLVKFVLEEQKEGNKIIVENKKSKEQKQILAF